MLYYILLGSYVLGFLISLGYYLTRKPPSGDATVGWAIGIFYTAGLGGIILLALILKNTPILGFIVLTFPIIILLLPKIRRFRKEMYVRIPAHRDTPALTLFIENKTEKTLHIKLECWFATSKSHSASLYTTFDYLVSPLDKTSFKLNAIQTRLLAHKSKYVSIVIFEQVTEIYKDHTLVRDIQPCMQYSEVAPEAFRSGIYTFVVDKANEV